MFSIGLGGLGSKCGNRLQKAIFCEGFGQILVGADHAPACPVKQAVLGRQHDDGRISKTRIFLDQRTRLIAIEARHHDVAENDMGAVIGNFC